MFAFLMLLYFVASTASRLLIRTLTIKTKLDPYLTGSLIDVPTTILSVMAGYFLITTPIMQGLNIQLILISLAMGVFQVFWGYLSIISMKQLDTVTFTVIRLMTTPATVVLSSWFLGETLNLVQALGMFMILVGSFAVTSAGKVFKIQRLNRYEVYAGISALFLAINAIITNYKIDQTSLATNMIVLYPIVCIPGIIVGSSRLNKFGQNVSLHDIKLSLAIGIMTTVQIASFWAAVAHIDNLSLVAALGSFRVVTVLAGSYLVLKERSSPVQKLAGSTLALAGLLLSR